MQKKLSLLVLPLLISSVAWSLSPPTPDVTCCQEFVASGQLSKKCKNEVPDPSTCKMKVDLRNRVEEEWLRMQGLEVKQKGVPQRNAPIKVGK